MGEVAEESGGQIRRVGLTSPCIEDFLILFGGVVVVSISNSLEGEFVSTFELNFRTETHDDS